MRHSVSAKFCKTVALPMAAGLGFIPVPARALSFAETITASLQTPGAADLLLSGTALAGLLAGLVSVTVLLRNQKRSAADILKRESRKRHCCLFSNSRMRPCHSGTPSYGHEAERATITGWPIRLLSPVAWENGGCLSPGFGSTLRPAWENAKGQSRTMSAELVLHQDCIDVVKLIH